MRDQPPPDCWSSFLTTTVTTKVYGDIIRDFIILLEPNGTVLLLPTRWSISTYGSQNDNMITLLKEFFSECLVSVGIWSPGSPDLSAADFFLWGYVKIKVFHQPVEMISDGNSLLNSVTNSNHSCSFRKPVFLICLLLFLLFSLFYTNDSFTHHSIGTLCRKCSNVYSKVCTSTWYREFISVFNRQLVKNNLIYKREMVRIKFVFALLEKMIKK